MSLFTALPRAGLSHTIQISVCLAYPDRTNSSLPATLAQPSAQPPQAQQLFHGMNAHTLYSISSGSLPFSLQVSFVPLYSFILNSLLALVLFCCLFEYVFISSAVFVYSFFYTNSSIFCPIPAYLPPLHIILPMPVTPLYEIRCDTQLNS